jgi:hypothetical protein
VSLDSKPHVSMLHGAASGATQSHGDRPVERALYQSVCVAGPTRVGLSSRVLMLVTVRV